uniref:Uncharacterized protein n=1 Tax=Scophthalmus maximus TaxID=52904 RepID=A0A8D3BW02_SCOMX
QSCVGVPFVLGYNPEFIPLPLLTVQNPIGADISIICIYVEWPASSGVQGVRNLCILATVCICSHHMNLHNILGKGWCMVIDIYHSGALYFTNIWNSHYS